MRGAEIKILHDQNGIVQKVKVKRFINDEKVSDYTMTIGTELVVKPLNKQKLKHRDRRVQVLGFTENRDYGLRVNVKFLDNNRRGIIEIDDLDTFE